MTLRAFELRGADGRLIRGDRAGGSGRQILFITRVSFQALGE